MWKLLRWKFCTMFRKLRAQTKISIGITHQQRNEWVYYDSNHHRMFKSTLWCTITVPMSYNENNLAGLLGMHHQKSFDRFPEIIIVFVLDDSLIIYHSMAYLEGIVFVEFLTQGTYGYPMKSNSSHNLLLRDQESYGPFGRLLLGLAKVHIMISMWSVLTDGYNLEDIRRYPRQQKDSILVYIIYF